MRTTTIAAAFMAMASAVFAQDATDGFAVFANPAMDASVPAGKPLVLKWAAGTKYTGAAVLSLIGGETQGTQMPIADIATLPDVGVNTYTWNIDCSLGKAKVYGLKIALVDQPAIFQWSQRFHIDNSACDSSAAASTSGSASATSASSVVVSSSATSAAVYSTASAPESHSTTKADTSATVITTATMSHSSMPTVTKSTVPTLISSITTTKPSTTGSQTGANPIPTAAAHKVVAGTFALAGAAVAAVLAL